MNPIKTEKHFFSGGKVFHLEINRMRHIIVICFTKTKYAHFDLAG